MANTSDENLVPQPESEATILEPADWIRDLIRENLSVSEHEVKVLLSNMDIIDRLVKNSSTKFALFHLELTWNLDANEQEIQAKRDLDLLQRKDVPLINVVEPENIMAPSSEGKEENENDQPAMVFTDEYLRKMQGT